MEHLTEGLHVSNGVRFTILFVAFVGWLYVVYWIRHHEQVKQPSAIASRCISSPDTSIISSARKAIPIKSSGSQDIYAQNQETVSVVDNVPDRNAASGSMTINAGEAYSAPISNIDPDFDARFGSPERASK